MRKFLLSLTTLAGAALASASTAHAAPARTLFPVLVPPAHVQTVQYYEDWRHREWRRHEEERRHREEEWRRRHEYRHGW